LTKFPTGDPPTRQDETLPRYDDCGDRNEVGNPLVREARD
jgi:hypothetical protein